MTRETCSRVTAIASAGSPSAIAASPTRSTRASAWRRGELVAWINSDDYYAESERRCSQPRRRVRRRSTARHRVRRRRACRRSRRAARPVSLAPDLARRRIVTHPASFVLQPSLRVSPPAVPRRRWSRRVAPLHDGLRAVDPHVRAARGTRYIPRSSRARVITPTRSRSPRWAARSARRTRSSERRARLDLGALDRARMYAGVASLGVYWFAVRLGLKRAA